ncbi:MAG: DNA polymerase III subunit delta [Muribaculaceae bacterium]|nr:DNA polymerase III subunit delta [Muribaculaceae bacterium]
MAEKKESVTFASLRGEVAKGMFRPIYVLAGEEPYYIDQLSDLIVEQALAEDERDFNLSVYYGSDADVRDVIATCKQYPAFAQRRVVVLREAQLVPKQQGHKDDLDLFQHYAEHPLPSTVLVICHKGGALKSKSFLDELKRDHDGVPLKGVVMDSPRAKYDRDLRAVVAGYVATIGCNIDAKSVQMLTDYIGNDLATLFGQLDKLSILVGDNKAITPEMIEKNVGISKDYNNFELEEALLRRDAVKAYRIIGYFEKNPKTNPVPATVAMMFSFFSSVLIYMTAKDRRPDSLMAATGTKSKWRLQKFDEAARAYSKRGVVNIIHYLRECDVKTKGNGSRQDAYALLRELTYKILHA